MRILKKMFFSRFINLSKIIFITLLLLVGLSGLIAQQRPFPQSLNYPGCIKPDVTQDVMNTQVKSYYDYWKAKYIKPSARTPNGYYVNAYDLTDILTDSEIHGYGMIITALMGDKMYYDGLYCVFKDHPSLGDSDLMSDSIHHSESPSHDTNSFTGGDLGIAYSMLLAHAQWGSNGQINYINEAQRMIENGIKEGEISPTTLRVMLNDTVMWNKTSPVLVEDHNTTIPNNWTTSYMRAFNTVTGNAVWNEAADLVYDITEYLQKVFTPHTGLVPNYVINDPPEPAHADSIEGPYDGDYGWTACLFPLRIALDYAHYENTRAFGVLQPLINFFKNKHNDPGSIMAGYLLNGEVIPVVGYTSMAYTGPVIAACITDNAHKEYLTSGWNALTKTKEGPYEDTINLLCQLLISGNWFNPVANISIPTPTPEPTPIFPGTDLIENGDFSNASGTPWRFIVYGDADATAYLINGQFKVVIDKPGTDPDQIHLLQSGLQIRSNASYTYSFDAKADSPRTIKAVIRMSHDPWYVYSEDITVHLTTTITRYTYQFDHNWWTDFDAGIVFQMGGNDTPVYLDNISLKQGTGPLIDVALNKPVYSSGDYSLAYSKDKINDGNPATVWGSALATNGSQWIFIDLGQEYPLNSVLIDWYKEYYARRYSLGYSTDMKTWTLGDDYYKNKPGPDRIALPGVTTRYIGLLCKEANSIAYGIASFEVYR